jgi:hypothetical protein
MSKSYFVQYFSVSLVNCNQTLRLITVRRLFNSISKFLLALSLLLLAWSGCNVGYAMTLVCAGFFFNGAMSPGHYGSYTDLAPNFSGTIFGISNTFSGGATGFIVPLIIGVMTQDQCCQMSEYWYHLVFSGDL